MREKKKKRVAKRTNATKNQGNTKTIKPIDATIKSKFWIKASIDVGKRQSAVTQKITLVSFLISEILDWYLYFHPYRAKKCLEAVQLVSSQKNALGLQKLLRTADGETGWMPANKPIT